MQNLHVNTIIAKFFVGQNIVTSQKQTHDLPFFGGATGVVNVDRHLDLNLTSNLKF